MRKIAVVTGTRAEYGLLYWIIKDIHLDHELELQLVVTGMHLSPEFGLTVKDIEKDGFPIADRVELLLSSDTETAIATSMGLGTIGFAKTFERLRPDILVVLGDRFEILSATVAAIPFRIPIAHIHGGESTEGAMDEAIRHAVTKMSHIHFTSTEKYRLRIIQMGENSDYIFNFGSPGLDNIRKLQLLNDSEIRKTVGAPENKKMGIVTFHPVTLESSTAGPQVEEMLNALKLFSDVYWVITLPNADTGGRVIIWKITEFFEKKPDAGKVFVTLGVAKYLSLLKHANLMVGNSSSGLLEAPSFKLPVVNIGDRQKGRVKTENVINVSHCETEEIADGINRGLSQGFRKKLNGLVSPYGDGMASEKIVNELKSIEITERLIKKHFMDRIG